MQITKAFTIFLVSIGCLVFGTCGEQNSDESKTLLPILEISSSNLLVNPTMINTQNMSVDPESEPERTMGLGNQKGFSMAQQKWCCNVYTQWKRLLWSEYR
ncbi:hypothetical protein B1J94_09860 [Leptospira kirschneri serovar Grippotyphosa]|nr:hypothetical protein B1J94_09860 [Leptospira kirschneri serovar Grippotyphosa]